MPIVEGEGGDAGQGGAERRRQEGRQAAALTGARSVTTRLFTAAEQAQNHCHVGNIGASVRAILSWLDSLR
ncbi:hypothetical protein [Amycolatopsis anabasis]|uniref:hypothetical protein n=1 Tax=Amycolatopsis anabasis TaxID=1840409 RepID=UPI001FE66A82|nr:hypothetical protein [Amycolatopsis anabasis]